MNSIKLKNTICTIIGVASAPFVFRIAGIDLFTPSVSLSGIFIVICYNLGAISICKMVWNTLSRYSESRPGAKV